MEQREGAAVITVLHVDDDEDVLWATSRYLRRHGFEVRTAATAAAALELAERELPRLVVLDLNLANGEDGYALALALRGLPGAERLPVVFYSSAGGARLHGVTSHVLGALALPKSAGPALLHRAIAQALTDAQDRDVLSAGGHVHT